ncbi:unnamed protein product, partial [Cuscuta epithymum]
MKDKLSGEVLLQASSNGGVYPISLSSTQPVALISYVAPGPVWHRRLGHCGNRILAKLKKSGSILSTSSFSHDCISCRLGRSQRLPFQEVWHKSIAPLYLIHSDVWQSPIVSES